MDRLSVGGRRLTLTRAGHNLTGVPRSKTGSRSHRHTSDTTSDVQHTSRARYENTYKLPPSDNERFQAHKVQQVIYNVLESRLKDVAYDQNSSTAMAKELADEIHRRVKEFQWKRYKFVCHLMVGQCTGQGIQVASRCLWDDKLDNYSCVQYTNKSLLVVAHCFGVYFE